LGGGVKKKLFLRLPISNGHVPFPTVDVCICCGKLRSSQDKRIPIEFIIGLEGQKINEIFPRINGDHYFF
jgi:hypothetical protein